MIKYVISYMIECMIKYMIKYDQVLDWCAQLLEILGGRYGTELTSKGFRRLASKLRVLHSSWVCHDTLEPILSRMRDSGWSADNVAFGNDGELLQYLTSDDQECHLECSHVLVGASVVCIHFHRLIIHSFV